MALHSDEEFLKIYHRHVDTVYRICFSFMKNSSDTEDMVQETFLKLLSSGKRFESENHEKAWLIVTASNACKDVLKHWWRKNQDIADCEALAAPFEVDGILSAVLNLPDDYKTAVFLYYYEGYGTEETARILGRKPSTVRAQLTRARHILARLLKEEL